MKEVNELLLQLETVSRKPKVTYRPDGQMETHLRVIEDALGKKIGSQRAEWIYYGTGEVDIIIIIDRDANDTEVKRRTIKHFLDGKQPISY